ncbi:hypothetical protein [Arenibacter sp. ARW7G5Y1]|uniref:hypothetical protein n=1 Tax=Arenibacter sp. ARW7G5Y1 TaxID=2135619 RepID=UPI000D9BDD13|nr:hypothetical protein [Arenibacter sp. ARW7G5Y1]PXX30641.1 hypothetical protein C7972_102270 [Arenibacter sp. ARW7G5Y1]
MNFFKSISFLIIGLLICSCSSEIVEMNEGEKYLANKIGAEWTSIGLTQSESKTNGQVTENRTYIDIVIKQSEDIDKIFEDTKYAEKRTKNVAQFVLDSLQFGEMSFKPEEIQVEYVKESGFLIFKSEKKQSMSYKLNK